MAIADCWWVAGDELRVARRVAVHGNGPGGFWSALTLADRRPVSRAQADWFAPGLIYGSTRHLPPEGRTDRTAIGSAVGFRPPFHGIVRVREDRLPAPMFGVRFRDGTSITLLHSDPDGATTAADAAFRARTLVDGRLRFGAIGAEQSSSRLRLGFWFPGTEGEISYVHNDASLLTRPRWVRREHPLRDGLRQSYALRIRFGAGEGRLAYRTAAWRWAWRSLRPRVHPYDLQAVRRALAGMLLGRFVTTAHGTAIPMDWDAVTGQELLLPFRPAGLGFIGKDVENAALLLEDARHPGPRRAAERTAAVATVDTFARLPLWPPAATGFDLATGTPTSFYPAPGRSYLRAITDDMRALMRAIALERAAHRAHPGWLRWARRFADWLLTRQRRDGGFPRAWANGTGQVLDPETSGSDEPVPFLLDLARLTGDSRYRRAALRAGRHAWALHRGGQWWGGTIDQGDVISKESASTALAADMALYRATRERRWLARAQADERFLETWIYLWDVPMPVDVRNSRLAWKRGVPTTGLNLVTTGASVADEYSSQDVPELAELYAATGDRHVLDVARLLLHDANAMLALPGRTYDLAGPGWQQEFWTLSLPRGTGQILGGHRDWVPWVTAVKLRAILVTEHDTPAVWRLLTRSG